MVEGATGAVEDAEIVERLPETDGGSFDFGVIEQQLRDDPAALCRWLTRALANPDSLGVWSDLAFAVGALGAGRIARAGGLNHASVLKAFRPHRQPSLSLTLRIFDAMGVEVVVRPKRRSPRSARGASPR
jgi:DNA-binding phage protein